MRACPDTPLCRAENVAFKAPMATGLLLVISPATLARMIHELGSRHYLIHQATREGLLGRVLAIEVPHLLRPFAADGVLEVPGPVSRVEAPDERTDLAEHRMLRRNREVAHVGEHVAAANGEAIDRGDDGLRDRVDSLVDVNNGHHGRVVQGRRLLVLAADTEELVPRARQNCRAQLRVDSEPLQGLRKLQASPRAEPVCRLLAINGDRQYRVFAVHDDVLIVRHALVSQNQGAGQRADCPPSRTMVSPVMKSDSLPARRRTQGPISLTSPMRRTGIARSTRSVSA